MSDTVIKSGTAVTQTTAPSPGINTPTKQELLGRARSAIEAGETSLREAAEALAVAQELHGASQAEMARAVGKSETWVSRLLQWRREGYRGDSPFGPTTEAGRVAHAQDRAASGKSKPRKLRKPKTPIEETDSPASVGEAAVDARGRKASSGRKPSPEKAKGELKYAIDHWWPHLDDDGKVEMTAYLLKKTGARAS